MKHQYFGDTRDLFKYDLIETLVFCHPSLERVFLIPMLTPDDGSGHGARVAYSRARAGNQNTGLADFLSGFRNAGLRNCFMIRDYYDARSIPVCIEESPFSHHERQDYFTRTARKLHGLSHMLVFLDPDTGLEVTTSGGGHLLFDEVNLVARSMGPESVLMIYQHIPRKPRISYIEERCASLSGKTGIPPSWISDGQVVFFFLCHEQAMRRDLESCLLGYHRRYPLLLARPDDGCTIRRPR